MKRHVLKGIIKAEDRVWCEGDYLTIGDVSLSEYFEDNLSGRTVSARYWIADKEMPYNELLKSHIKQLYGDADYNHGVAYSEYTGYLWTDDEAKIGGHDLVEELDSHDKKYCYLEIDEYEVGDELPN